MYAHFFRAIMKHLRWLAPTLFSRRNFAQKLAMREKLLLVLQCTNAIQFPFPKPIN